MAICTCDGEKDSFTKHSSAYDLLNNRPRPLSLFIKVCFIIVLCEAATEALMHLLAINSIWETIIETIMLTVICSISLYNVIVKPMGEILETSEKVESDLGLFRGLLDKSNDAILIIDPENREIYRC